MKITPRQVTAAALFTFALALASAGCEDPENFLEGSLTSVWDTSFDAVEVTQYLQSKSLHVEYVRHLDRGEEKPVMITISPVPEGPGTFTHGEAGYEIDISGIVSSSAQMPPMSSGTVTLNAFTPGAVDSEVSGTVGAMFTGGGDGDAFSLEGAFKATLIVVP